MNKTIQNILPAISIILFAVILRLIPHPPNMAPIAAMALFGGVYLDKKYALVIPLIAMVISDFFIGFHDTMLFVYGSFLLTGFIGLWMKKIKTVKTIVASSFLSSVLFFLITNFGVWLAGTMYPQTVGGLLETYIMALPFFKNTLLGDLFYTGLFFGSFELIQRLVVSGNLVKIKS